MPRNSGGSYTLPASNPVVTHTTITSSWANSTLSDIGSELTSSLDRSGRGAMLAPLPLANGSSALPALTFSSETASGLFRNASQDLEMSINGTVVQKWLSTGITAPLGATLTQSQTNTVALVATGNGTAAGATFTGGSSNGAGATFLGGGTSGAGLNATGASSNGAGGVFTGGAGGGNAVVATGGATSGSGGYFTGGATNGVGAKAFGTGTGAGVQATGGATSGPGITATGGAPDGIGVIGTAASSAAYGVEGVGVSGGPGLYARSSSTSVDALKVDGYVNLDGAADVSNTTPFTNQLTPKNVQKAWAKLTMLHLSGPSVTNGFNVANVLVGFTGGNTTATVFFAQAMANQNYAVTFGPWVSAAAPTVVLIPATVSQATDQFSFKVVAYDTTTGSGGFVDFTGALSDMPIHFDVSGEQ